MGSDQRITKATLGDSVDAPGVLDKLTTRSSQRIVVRSPSLLTVALFCKMVRRWPKGRTVLCMHPNVQSEGVWEDLDR